MGQGDSKLKEVQGYQIARILPNGPAHLAGLVPYFDIITAVDRLPLMLEQPSFFVKYLQQNTNRPNCFTAFNLRTRQSRDVTIIPSNNWGGAGLLGCSIEWVEAEACIERSYHIVEIAEGSPADKNPYLLQRRDYVIGMQPAGEPITTMIHTADELEERLYQWREKRWGQIEMDRQKQAKGLPLVGTGTNGQYVPHNLLLLIYDSLNNVVKEVCVDMAPTPMLRRAMTEAKYETELPCSLGISFATGFAHVIDAVPDDSYLPRMGQFYLPSAGRYEVLSQAPVAAEAVSHQESSAAPPSSIAFPNPPTMATTGPAVSGSPEPPDLQQTAAAPSSAPALSAPTQELPAPVQADSGLPEPPGLQQTAPFAPGPASIAVPQPTATQAPELPYMMPPPIMHFPTFPSNSKENITAVQPPARQGAVGIIPPPPPSGIMFVPRNAAAPGGATQFHQQFAPPPIPPQLLRPENGNATHSPSVDLR